MRHYRLHTHVKLFALPELIAFLRSALAFHRAHMSNTSPVRSSGAGIIVLWLVHARGNGPHCHRLRGIGDQEITRIRLKA